MKHNSFYQLFTEQLQDIYSAENQILHSLPKLIQAASLPELKVAFQAHLKDTQRQVQRLKKVFSHLDIHVNGKTCHAMEGLIRESKEIISHFPASALRDAALISAAQKVEHYEIAGYGTARTYAKHLELDQVADLLQKSLDEEGVTNKKLTRLAEGGFFNRGINEEAKKEESGLNAKKLREVNEALESEEYRAHKARKSSKKVAAKKVTAKKTVKAKVTKKTGKIAKVASLRSEKTTASKPRSKTSHTTSHARISAKAPSSRKSQSAIMHSGKSYAGRSASKSSMHAKSPSRSSKAGIQARGRSR